MINNSFITSSVLAMSLALASSALAADPVVAIDPVPAAVDIAPERFCGPYAGIQAGYAWGEGTYGGPWGEQPSMDGYLDEGKADGALGGLYAGCNFRMGQWLAGVEGDVNLLGAGYDDGWVGTVRIRGGATFANTLVYATGGVALGQVDLLSWGNMIRDQLRYSSDYVYLDKPVAVGWAAGFGVEHWFGEKVSWKTEYLYMDLGEVTSFGFTHGDMRQEQVTVDWKAHTVRTGIAIHF